MEKRNEVISKLLEDNGSSKKLKDRIDKIDVKVEEISENFKVLVEWIKKKKDNC